MKALKIGIGSLVLAISAIAAPSAAGAARVVPPENSAATQYTEAFPTAGGPKDTSHPEGKGRERSPSEVLGRGRARRLQAQGAQGRKVAEVVAETAPTSVSRPAVQSGGKPEGPNAGGGQPAMGNGPAAATGGSGSSSLGEVAGQATGSSSSGEMGLLLPLLIVAALLWASIYWSRQRKRPAA